MRSYEVRIGVRLRRFDGVELLVVEFMGVEFMTPKRIVTTIDQDSRSSANEHPPLTESLTDKRRTSAEQVPNKPPTDGQQPAD